MSIPKELRCPKLPVFVPQQAPPSQSFLSGLFSCCTQSASSDEPKLKPELDWVLRYIQTGSRGGAGELVLLPPAEARRVMTWKDSVRTWNYTRNYIDQLNSSLAWKLCVAKKLWRMQLSDGALIPHLKITYLTLQQYRELNQWIENTSDFQLQGSPTARANPSSDSVAPVPREQAPSLSVALPVQIDLADVPEVDFALGCDQGIKSIKLCKF